MKKTIAILCLAALLLGTMVGCSKDMSGEMEYGGDGDQAMSPGEQADNVNGWYSADSLQGSVIEGDEVFAENPFIKTAKQAVSTFSADVDTASYSYFRKLVGGGYGLNELIDMAGASIRTEEMINYFDYSYNLPKEGELFGTSVQIAPSPWNENAKLMVLGLATEQPAKRLDNNLVFLIDVSGSMSAQDKLPLLKNAFSQLAEQLGAQDTVSIVTYSGKEEIVLEGCMGSKSEQILAAVNGLKASGSTNGEAGLQQAYELAARYFKEDGNNRIIMASDGDLNVGISSEEELEKFVEQKRESGIYLSVLGFGTGNYKDSKMETIANHGNGIYYYIDGASEAERVFGSKLLSTLQTVGTDVKLQVTFDPSMVDSYRLVGYENRLMKEEDFKDDSKDGSKVT